MTSLWGPQRTNGGSSASKNLVEFRAGKLNLRGSMVHPDKRKGQVYLHQSDDSLMHFCWKDRTSGAIEDDLIIFPDDCECKRVTECTTGRVYLLKFKSSNNKFFFWMQEPKEDKDVDFCTKINEYLNHPPVPSATGRSSDSARGTGHPHDFRQILDSIPQDQLMSLLSGGGGGMTEGGINALNQLLAGGALDSPSASSLDTATSESRPTSQQTTPSARVLPPAADPPTAPSSNAPAASIQLSDLQSILSGMPKPAQQVDLSGELTLNLLAPIIAKPEVQTLLRPLLPDGGESDRDELPATLSSPQFQQSLRLFQLALHSGQLGPVLRQLNICEAACLAADNGDMEGFVKALEKDQKGEDGKDNMDTEGGV